MKNVLSGALLRAALALLPSGCDAGLLVGEKDCYGVDCDSDAPTLSTYGEEERIATRTIRRFDLTARSVAPTWVYEHPVKFPHSTQTQLAAAPGGGVWALIYSSNGNALQRINEVGEAVESHALSRPGRLSVDDELGPVVTGSRAGRVFRATLGPLGKVFEWFVDDIAPLRAPSFVIDAPDGHIRLAVFEEGGSHVAEYDARGDLVWRQTQLRDARDALFEISGQTISSETPPEAIHRMVSLSDGSIVLAVAKRGLADASFEDLGEPERSQGLTLLEPDGNLRWDQVLGRPTVSMLVAPGLDGSIIYASGPPERVTRLPELDVLSIDRDGSVVASWIGWQASYYGAEPSGICSDPAGAIYVLLHTGERTAPIPTVCRMNPSEPSEEVVCLGVEGVVLPMSEPRGTAALRAITAPEPGVVVFSVEESDWKNERMTARVVRIDF